MVIEKQASRVIIGGSGPSLARIDYTRLPTDAQIWRVNDFFKESKYFLGRRADAVFNGGHPDIIIDRYHTLRVLAEKNVYDVNFNMIFADKLFDELPDLFKGHFEKIRELDKANNIGLWSLIEYNDLFLDRHPLTGTCAILVAMLCGYREIYLAGIDNDYTMGAQYAYSNQKTRKSKLKWVELYHPSDLQWGLIKKYQEKLGGSKHVKIYSLSLESPAAKIFPMAPINKNAKFKLEAKQSQQAELLKSPWYPDSVKLTAEQDCQKTSVASNKNIFRSF